MQAVVRVKICGLTNLEDAKAALDFGADALGFVFYPQSPRCVGVDQVRSIIEALPPYITTVGVFADQTAEEIEAAIVACALSLVQLQGDEPPGFCERFGPRAVKAIRVKDRESLDQMVRYHVRAFVLDTYRPDQFGGTGDLRAPPQRAD